MQLSMLCLCLSVSVSMYVYVYVYDYVKNQHLSAHGELHTVHAVKLICDSTLCLHCRTAHDWLACIGA